MDNDKKQSSSFDRQLRSYPHPKIYQLVTADAHVNMESVSSKVASILKNHYDALPESKRQQLLKVFDSLSEEQIHPRKNQKGYLSKHNY